MKAAYNNLKNNARRRGKQFELSFKDFKEFCIRTDYIAGKGRTRKSYHIDRIDPSKGYTKDNIQVLTNIENVRKQLHAIYDDLGYPINYVVSDNLNPGPDNLEPGEKRF